MSSRSRAIWCEVEGTGRKHEPTFGSDDCLTFDISVGSAKNSNHFVKLTTINITDSKFAVFVDDFIVGWLDLDTGERLTLSDYIDFEIRSKRDASKM